MAERSKAPDSRFTFSVDDRDYREFWSSYEGVGSNPTSDKTFFKKNVLFYFIKKILKYISLLDGLIFKYHMTYQQAVIAHLEER